MDEFGLSGKVVLVTGGGKGVGRGISEQYLSRGAQVIVCGRQSPESLPEKNGNRAVFIAADVRDAAQVDAMLSRIASEYGRIDILINNAGGTPFSLAANGSQRYHEGLISLNLTAPLMLAIKVNEMMQKQGEGVVVFISSISASTARPGTATYAAAKAGVASLVTSLAIEWAPKVRVVSVSPGLVHTEQAHLHYGDESGIAAVSATIPLQRMATPADIGNACVLLSSPLAAYISGTDLLVHGGGEKPSFLSAANVNAA